jgi:alpha-beta hydrolase superfamily lysophospholipase
VSTEVEIDVLGEPYERRVIDLGRDDEGPVIATLVSRRAEQSDGRAVLYIHGFVDYFFQTHLADFFVDRGWDFHAIDLRKYGRSLLPHQTPNFCRDVSEYFPELDAAAEIIGARTLLVNGHSTGGLIAAHWAHARRSTGIVDGLFLNSPCFDFNARWVERRPLLKAIGALGRRQPYRIVPFALNEVYGQSIHSDHKGEWTYNLEWKPIQAFPIRAGWLRAIGRAQQQLRAGLAIPAPILVAASTRSFRGKIWHDDCLTADAVLDVEHIATYAPRLGSHVTVVRFDGGRHDLTLSGPAVREQVFSEVGRWVDAFVTPPPPVTGADAADGTTPGAAAPAGVPAGPADAAATTARPATSAAPD